METGNGRDQAQAQTVARRVTALFEPVEALEHVIALFGGNARTIVGDRDHRPAAGAATGHGDLPARAAVLDRVVDEIGDGVEQQVAVPGNRHLAVAVKAEAGRDLLGRGVVELDDLAGNLGEARAHETRSGGRGSRSPRSA